MKHLLIFLSILTLSISVKAQPDLVLGKRLYVNKTASPYSFNVNDSDLVTTAQLMEYTKFLQTSLDSMRAKFASLPTTSTTINNTYTVGSTGNRTVSGDYTVKQSDNGMTIWCSTIGTITVPVLSPPFSCWVKAIYGTVTIKYSSGITALSGYAKSILTGQKRQLDYMNSTTVNFQ